MRGLVLVLFLIGMAMATTASAQMEAAEPAGEAPSAADDPSLLEYFAANAEDPILAEVLASIQAEQMHTTSSAEILYGSRWTDTIVYGDIVSYGNWGSCTGYSERGRGICVFALNASDPHQRGVLRFWTTWSAGAVNPLGIGGDPFEGPTWAEDYIYPADFYLEPYIYCGYSGGFYHFVAMNYAFPAPVCGDGTADFPADAQMEIRGDGGHGDSTGRDHIYGWNNADTLMGDGGDDFILHGGGGADTINGDKGADVINAGLCTSGTEWLYGGFDDVANDWIDALGNNLCQKRLYGGPGNDTLRGSVNADYISGGDGMDILCGDQGANTLYGGNGNDVLAAKSTSYCDGGGQDAVPPGDRCAGFCNPAVSCESWGATCPY